MNTNSAPQSNEPADPKSIPSLALSALGDFRHVVAPLIVFEGFLKGAVALIGLIGTIFVVAPLIARSGRAAVTNKDIAGFLLSKEGVTVGFLLLFGTLLASVVEHVGVMAIVSTKLRGRSVTPERVVNALASVFLRLVGFQLKALSAVIVVSAPFVLLAGLTYLAFLNEHDINFYLSNRPPVFYIAVVIGGILGMGLSLVLIRLFVRGVFVIPSLVVANLDSWSAVRASRELTQGAMKKIGGVLVGWHVIGMLLGILAVWGFSRGACWILGVSSAWPRALVPIVGLLLVAQMVVLSLVSTLLVAVESALILRLYFERKHLSVEALKTSEPVDAIDSRAGMISAAAGATLRSVQRFWLISLFAFSIGVGLFLYGLSQRLGARPKVAVVAHRGYSHVAPENTLAAFRKSIDVGAQYVELDVQQTKDGELVINHDRDFMRVAGDSRRVSDLTLAEIKTIDVGRKFSSRFIGEHAPTLEEVIDLARGKIRLQIELKYYDKDAGLAEKVAALVERLQFESECVVISLDYEALQKAKRRNPKLKTAAIVTYAIGDIGRLKVDALSVHTSQITNRLLREARSQGKEVYAWTVDDPHQMIALIEQGVSSLVTNVPSQAVSICREMEGLSDVERRIMTARYMLGLEPDLLLERAAAASNEPAAGVVAENP